MDMYNETANQIAVRKALDAYSTLMKTEQLNNGILENMKPSSAKNALITKRDDLRSIYNPKISQLFNRLSVSANMTKPTDFLDVSEISTVKLAESLGYYSALGDFKEKELYYQMSLVTPLNNPQMGSFLDVFSPITSAPVIQHTDAEDEARGLQTLQYFYDQASTYPNFQMSFDNFIATLKQQMSLAVNSVGMSTYTVLENQTGFTESDVKNAMVKLADAGQGQIPDNWMSYSSALTASAVNPSFFTSLKYTAAATAGEITSGVVSTGKNLITGIGGLSGLLKYLPVILIGGGALYLFTLGGGVGSVIKSMKKAK